MEIEIVEVVILAFLTVIILSPSEKVASNTSLLDVVSVVMRPVTAQGIGSLKGSIQSPRKSTASGLF